MKLRALSHPARVIPAAYAGAIVVGSGLLMIPAATAPGQRTELLDAAFTAVSALCITGLTTVSTATHWTPTGHLIIMCLIQVGGFGIMSLATIVALAATGRIGLQGSLIAQNELHAPSIGDAWRLPLRIGAVMLVSESVVATALTIRFHHYTGDWGAAAWNGVFHAVSAFNNAGFSLYPMNLEGFVADGWLIIPLCTAIVAGGLGFPVFFELFRRRRLHRPRSWSLHARITVWGTVALLIIGCGLFGLFEWQNPGTLGPLDAGGKVVGAIAGGVFPRTAGFNSIDYGHATDLTIGLNYLLMFIGGGSAGTAGGIKVGTFVVLLSVVVAEIRGDEQAAIGRRAIATSSQRSAVSVVVLALIVIVIGTAVIVAESSFSLQSVLFEAISAFGTVGLSTGITPHLGPAAKISLMALMYMGRVGTISVAAAFALRQRRRRYRLPEEHPIVG